MWQLLNPAIIRILKHGEPVGAGCLVRERYAVTCAHVVTDALDLERETVQRPSQLVSLDFPFLQTELFEARVVQWLPYQATVPADGRSDIAVLELPDLPPESEPARLIRSGMEWTGPAWAYGFPAGSGLGAAGDWIEGRSAPFLANGWFKLLGSGQPNAFIQPGCSGGPVSSEPSFLVAGIVSLRATDVGLKEAYAISGALLRDVVAECLAPVEPSTTKALQRLREVLGGITAAAEAMAASPQAPENLAKEIAGIAEMLGRCARSSPSPADLEDLATYNEELADVAGRVREQELEIFFEVTPFRPIVDALDDLTRRSVPRDLPASDEIPIDQNDEAVKKLRETVKEEQRRLDGAEAKAVFADEVREKAWRALQDIAIALWKPFLSLRRIDRSRLRLKTLHTNWFDHAEGAIRLFLGHHAERLQPGMIFQEESKEGVLGPEMVVIPAGSFQMGSPVNEEDRKDVEGPQHAVQIAELFALGRYPVTFDEYDRFTTSAKRKPVDDQGWGRGRRPVINVSWEDAEAYVAWLGEVTGQPYRLPSEAEWEYACRAGTTTPFHFGSTISTDQANYAGTSTYGSGAYGSGPKGAYRGQTVPVGSFPANGFGLHDMHGNVMEWCADVWHDSYEGSPTDGTPWLKGGDQGRRVLRGGSWDFDTRFLCSASRTRKEPDTLDDSISFRVARSLR